MQVSVRDNNVDQALRVLKKKLQSEGVFQQMKLKQSVVPANWRGKNWNAKRNSTFFYLPKLRAVRPDG